MQTVANYRTISLEHMMKPVFVSSEMPNKLITKQILLLSSSQLHGYEYLQHAKKELNDFLNKNQIKKILFIPYALKCHEKYTKAVEKPLAEWGFEVEGIHNAIDPIAAVRTAQAIFVGGGNSFVLLKNIYEKELLEPIRDQVLNHGTVYIGSSAGTNIATRTIETTNDMPVVYPPSFNSLCLVPFNINPHYVDPPKQTTHKGETRDERIREFIQYNDIPVLGLREGTSVYIDGDNMTAQGKFDVKLFCKDNEEKNFPPGTDLSFLLKQQ